MKKHKEGDTVNAILDFLHAHRIPAWRINTGATKIGGRFLRFGVVGMSDIIGIRWTTDGVHQYGPMIGQFLAIEVKAAKGKVSAPQQSFLKQVQDAGGIAFVARSVLDVQHALGFAPSPTVGGISIAWATARRLSREGP